MIAIRYDIKNNYFEMEDKTTNTDEMLTLCGILIDMVQVATEYKLSDEAMLDFMHRIRKQNIKGVVIRTNDKSKLKKGKSNEK